MQLLTKHIDTPLGKMMICASDEGVCIFDFAFRRMMPSIMARVKKALGAEMEEGDHPYMETLTSQLNEYFSGERKEFNLPLHFLGSAFQLKVWEGLQQIPYGQTRSYKSQSIYLGDEKAIRAVARANGENGLAIIVPCHRVIGEDGSLTGYAGGLRAKQWLLDHERKHSGAAVQQQLFVK
jgi:AraC family transcriptional regulator of adaptative response/methylated-DNA-[protein]-cysteine methyltransferase